MPVPVVLLLLLARATPGGARLPVSALLLLLALGPLCRRRRPSARLSAPGLLLLARATLGVARLVEPALLLLSASCVRGPVLRQQVVLRLRQQQKDEVLGAIEALDP